VGRTPGHSADTSPVVASASRGHSGERRDEISRDDHAPWDAAVNRCVAGRSRRSRGKPPLALLFEAMGGSTRLFKLR